MASGAASVSPAIGRTFELFEPERRSDDLALRDGYLDLLGETDPTGSRLVQRAMTNRLLPYVYERLWRPVGIRMASGRRRVSFRQERAIAAEMLALSDGDRVLDVGCGPGNFARYLAGLADGALVVGVDASPPMLAAAARRTSGKNVAYVRADAGALPFRASSFDAVCCFAVLHLIEYPQRALDEMVRVLAPGGRLGLLASCRRERSSARRAERSTTQTLGGVRLFAHDEIPQALGERGLLAVEQRVTGIVQFVSGRKPG